MASGTRRRGRRNWRLVIGGAMVCLVALASAGAPWLSRFPPNRQDVGNRLKGAGTRAADGVYWLGTDQLGRDVLARLLYGGRVSLMIGLASVLGAGAFGVLLGLIAGYAGGVTDACIMRLCDVQMAFPFVLLALAIVAVLGPGIGNVILVFVVSSWAIYARTTRASVLSLREREFVLAARCLGCSPARIVARHIALNAVAPLVVIATFEVARITSTEAALSFLGMGVPPRIPSWGTMIADGREYLQSAWWIATVPGLGLALTVIGINYFGDGLREAVDPRLRPST